MATVGIIPLVDKADGEDELSRRAEDEQPQRHRAVMQEVRDEVLSLREHHTQCRQRQCKDSHAEDHRDARLHSFDIQVPDIDIIGDELTEDDTEIVPQPAVDEQQDTPR